MPVYKTRNEHFFKKWTPDMAYVLGFFTADGNMIRNKRGGHFIEFTTADKIILEKIREALGSNHKITGRKRSDTHQMCYRLQIGSKTWFNDLSQLGLMPNKSKKICLPEIPQKYFSHFVRGYFDGDGHVTISRYKRANRNYRHFITILSGFTSGSKKFLEQLHAALKNITDISGGTLFYSKGYRLVFSVNDSYTLYRFLYKNPENEFCLARKKEKFEKYFITYYTTKTINAAVV